ncbi:helix-turn-helix transcriptional regulator [Altererythrobacter lutimaris]|uniref:LuxR family transcriptional regulator n=1 Tax=Altererythrobacter lutimaris TaxID=2743979 RepID=A0A850HF24_9SPHN|nr:LuxR family transcriptional regulator [Altererythrobacter lutimaris]NVE95766.1 LuxR family transcriptional regulator [Altererythrobacter lutimaris]
MREHMATIDSLGDLTSVLEFVRDICLAHGVLRMSYHFSPIFEEPTSIRTVVYAHGFSPEWLALYEEADFRAHDPIPSRTFAHGGFLTWMDAMEAEPNTPEQEAYLQAMKKAGLQHGFGVPLYGARGREAYASFDFGEPLDDVDPERIGLVRALAQGAHQRLCNLIDQERAVPELSQREAEVLTWVARGKSNTDIGTILDLSPETVRTYRKRVYEKLEVFDQIGAIIRALRLGLIHI